MRYARIIGTGSFLPEKTVTNDDLAQILDTSDQWISSRTGIRKRRISTDEVTSDLATKAGEKALKDAGLEAKDIDLIICATITPETFMPSVACVVQDRLGAYQAAAFDLSAACTGMIYGMVVGQQFIENGTYKNVLIIGAETLSKVLDWNDRSTCVLFGDGAGAVILSASQEKRGIVASQLIADGSKKDLLVCNALPSLDNAGKITMEGHEVFKYAVRTITDNIKSILDKAGLDSEDINYVIPHQANQRIIELAAKYCDIAIEKFYINLDRYGNTSAASIGIALDEMIKENKPQVGDKIILVGFGGGMTSGATLIIW